MLAVVTHTEVVALSDDGITLRKGRGCFPASRSTDSASPTGTVSGGVAAAEAETYSPDEYEVAADVVLWAAGSRPSSLLESLGLPLDERGR